MANIRQSTIRTIVRGAYDVQKLRIQTGNRIVGNFRAKLGQEPGELTETLDKEAQELLADLKKRYRRIADAITTETGRLRNIEFPGDEVISDYTEFALVEQYLDLERDEQRHFKRLEISLRNIPIYKEFLKKQVGIGPAMAGVIISEFNIHAAPYVSSLWRYAGLDVAIDGDGLGRSKRKEHLVTRSYKNAKGEEAERMSVTYNPWLKTKLMGVLATSFMRSNSPWLEHYKNYRHRIESDPNRIMTDKPGFHKDNTWTKARRHQASLRYMIKMFLAQLYNEWRTLEGLPVHPTYQEAKLGHAHNELRQAS